MMKRAGNRGVHLQERLAWIYPWRSGDGLRLGTWLAVVVVTVVFVVVWATVRVKAPQMSEWEAPQAGLIVVTDEDPIFGEWSRRAMAMGPFPSRFDPRAWVGMADQNDALMAAARMPEKEYVPTLKELPEVRSVPSSLAPKGEPALPWRPLPSEGPRQGEWVMVPRLAVLSGIAVAELPSELPPFAAEVTPALAAGDWRFLVRLSPNGRVMDCVSMSGVAEHGALELRTWLTRVVFASSSAKAERWVGVRVEFKNQRLDDGTDTD